MTARLRSVPATVKPLRSLELCEAYRGNAALRAKWAAAVAVLRSHRDGSHWVLDNSTHPGWRASEEIGQ